MIFVIIAKLFGQLHGRYSKVTSSIMLHMQLMSLLAERAKSKP